MAAGTLETLEQRMTAMEQEIMQVKKRLLPENTVTANPWLDHVFGAFKDDPLFEEAVRYGREWREAQGEDNNPDAETVSDGHR